MDYLISIVVATKDRYAYLQSFVEYVLTFAIEGGVELIIHDNTADNSAFLTYLERLDSRIVKYYHVAEQIPVSENADRGVSYASGEYICFMGDDDLLSKYIVDFVRYMKENGIEAAIFNRAEYRWPGMHYVAHAFPSLTIPKYNGKITMLSPEKERRKVLKNGGVGLGRLPKAYQGVVKKSRMDQVRAATGSCFPAASPDMANAIALSYCVEKYVLCNIPLISNGQCPKSVGGVSGRHGTGNLNEVPFLPKDIVEQWNPRIPKIWTGTTIWAQSACEAIRRMDRSEDISLFNYSACYAMFTMFERRYRAMIQPLLKQLSTMGKINYIWKFIKLFFVRAYVYAKNFCMTRFHISSMRIYDHIATSCDAAGIIDTSIAQGFEGR